MVARIVPYIDLEDDDSPEDMIRRAVELFEALDDEEQLRALGGEVEVTEEMIHLVRQLVDAEEETADIPRRPLGIRLSDVSPAPIAWLSRGRLAEGFVHICDGDAGVGKSTILTEWAACITTGRALPDGVARPPAGVVVLTEEHPASAVRPRLEAAGGDATRVMVLDRNPHSADGAYQFPRDAGLLKQAIEQEQAALVIIDPWIDYVDPKLKVNSYSATRLALNCFVDVAESTGVAMMLVRHLNKSSDQAALYRGQGSSGIVGTARIVLLVAEHPEESHLRVLARTKGNFGDTPPSLVYRFEDVPEFSVARAVYEGESALSANELVVTDLPSAAGELGRAKDWVRERLADGPVLTVKLQDQARAAGISIGTLKRTYKPLGVTAKRTSEGWAKCLPRNAADGDFTRSDEGAQRDPDPEF